MTGYEKMTSVEIEALNAALAELANELKEETVRYFQVNFYADIRSALSPEGAPTIYAGALGEEWFAGHYDKTNNVITINTSIAPFDSEIIKAVILHELGHWASDMASWFGSRQPSVVPSAYGSELKKLLKYPELALRYSFEGDAGYAAEVAQFGRVLSWYK